MEANENVRRIEHIQDIPKTWSKASPEYKQGLTTLVERRYRQTVDRLERLLVQRLLELTKLGMGGTGMAPLIDDHSLLISHVYAC